ncbi:MAG: hypothetical protein IAF08_10150 [Rhizobacter sp.]|nr:hypothetical protein [Chlorobiales bacterium]
MDTAALAGIIASYNASATIADRIDATNIAYFTGNGYALNWQVRRGLMSEFVRLLRVIQNSSKTVYEKLRAFFFIASHNLTPNVFDIYASIGSPFQFPRQNRISTTYDWVRPGVLGEIIEQRFGIYPENNGGSVLPLTFVPSQFTPDFGLRQNGVRLYTDLANANNNVDSPQDGTIIKTNYDHSVDGAVTPSNQAFGFRAARPSNTVAAQSIVGFYVDGSTSAGVYANSSLAGVTIDRAFQVAYNPPINPSPYTLASIDTQSIYVSREADTAAQLYHRLDGNGSLTKIDVSFTAVPGETKVPGVMWVGGYQRGDFDRVQAIGDRTIEMVFASESMTQQEIAYFDTAVAWYLGQIKRRD